jgi:hypothetical protein
MHCWFLVRLCSAATPHSARTGSGGCFHAYYMYQVAETKPSYRSTEKAICNMCHNIMLSPPPKEITGRFYSFPFRAQYVAMSATTVRSGTEAFCRSVELILTSQKTQKAAPPRIGTRW